MPLGSRPAHVLYGGAHLFGAGSPAKLAGLAAKAMAEHAPHDGRFAEIVGADASIASELAARVRAKLERRPIEAMCIDFEDGYGQRSDAEEDAHADQAAAALATLALDPDPSTRPIVGIRIKALTDATRARALRTLDRFVTRLVHASLGVVPSGFTATLPKVSAPAEVLELTRAIEELESRLGISRGAIGVELMVETPGALYDAEGSLALPRAIGVAEGRCRAVHLGAYDLTASLGVVGVAQTLDHPACDHARTLMTLATAGTNVAVVDGATNTLPLGERADVERGWRLHAANVARALRFGIYEGWDLHPAQLPARYGALFAFFLQSKAMVGKRLFGFLDNAARATRVGAAFDDAATGRGLVAFFERGLACGALDERDLAASGIPPEMLRENPFSEAKA